MYVRVRALQQLEAVRMAAEVLHELSAPQSQRHAELPPRSCSRGRGPAIMQIARRGQNIVFVTASTRGNFSFSAAAVRRRVGKHRAA